jgi:hypothetical protein
MNRISRTGVAYWRLNERAWIAIKSVTPRDPWILAGVTAFAMAVGFVAMGQTQAAWIAAVGTACLPVLRALLGR